MYTQLQLRDSDRPPVTLNTLGQMKQRGEKIAALTAYDASFAALLDAAGVDIVLVGDTLGLDFLNSVATPVDTTIEWLDDGEGLLSWLDQAQLDRVGCFQYSPVEGAAANAIADAVPAEVKKQRYRRFMRKAGEISSARLALRIGRQCRVLVDAIEDGVAIARSSGDAPEIDGVVRINGAAGLRVGEFATVEITASDTYDLEARSAS